MDEPTRRAWSRPELIVLVRIGPEEAVLTVCKQANVSYHAANPGTLDQACLDLPGACNGQCNDLNGS